MKQNDSISKIFIDLVHPDDLAQALKKINESLQNGEKYCIEYRLKEFSSGNYRWFLGLASPLKNQKGKIIKWYGSLTDIHENKINCDKKNDQRKELKNALQARDEFISMASHQLKTPLTSLKLNSQLFKRTLIKNGPNQAVSFERALLFAEQSEKQINKLNKIVEDMLNVSDLKMGQFNLAPEEFNLSEMINEVITTINGQDENKFDNQINLNICHNQQELNVFLDKSRIEQVLVNLLSNSLRYGKGKKINVNLKIQDDKTLISIKDNGVGIAKENLGKIFEEYQKIETPNEITGMGLGLFVSKQIIESHGGKIWVDSELGLGSEFKIELPFEKIIEKSH